jgi:hypothetical protein
MSETDAEYGDVLYHREVLCLRCGIVLKRFSSFEARNRMFMNENGKVVSKSGFGIWHCYEKSDHVYDLNTKLQGQQKLICDMFGNVSAFEMKLKLFRNSWNVSFFFLNICFIKIDH